MPTQPRNIWPLFVLNEFYSVRPFGSSLILLGVLNGNFDWKQFIISASHAHAILWGILSVCLFCLSLLYAVWREVIYIAFKIMLHWHRAKAQLAARCPFRLLDICQSVRMHVHWGQCLPIFCDFGTQTLAIQYRFEYFHVGGSFRNWGSTFFWKRMTTF